MNINQNIWKFLGIATDGTKLFYIIKFIGDEKYLKIKYLHKNGAEEEELYSKDKLIVLGELLKEWEKTEKPIINIQQ